MIPLCTVAADYDDIVDEALTRAQIPYSLDRADGTHLIVRVAEADAARAQTALGRFGYFRQEGSS